MPQINISKSVFASQEYQSLSTIEKLTIFELTVMCPISIEQFNEQFPGREEVLQALLDKNYLAKNDLEFVPASNAQKIMVKDNSTERVRQSRERRLERGIKETKDMVSLIKEQLKELLPSIAKATQPVAAEAVQEEPETASKRKPIPYQEIADSYNEKLAIPAKIISCVDTENGKRRKNLEFAYKFVEERIVKSGKEATKEYTLKILSSVFEFASKSDQVPKTINDWTGNIDYYTRSTKFPEIWEKYVVWGREQSEKRRQRAEYERQMAQMEG